MPTKSKPKAKANPKRVRRHLRILRHPSPEECAEDTARAKARATAYDFLGAFIADTNKGTLDQRLDAARILVGGTY